MKIQQMKYPLPSDNARCLGTDCDQRRACQRHLTIEIDTDPMRWFGDFKKELNNDEDKCDFFIEFGGM